MILKEFIVSLTENVLMHPKKYLRPGHNGPYHDPETPVRNFSHWLITFAKCYEWTGERRFKDKVSELAEYLCSVEARPYRYSFHHRSKPGKDRCNGLIGQAWTFEALAEASAILQDEGYAALAEEVFFQHPFNYRFGLWKYLEIDGKVVDFDATFNHQLWFAACSSLIPSKRRSEIRDRITRFFDCLEDNLTVFSGGVVYHPIEHLLDGRLKARLSWSALMKRRIGSLLQARREDEGCEKGKGYEKAKAEIRKKFVQKSVGYHCFNMYAFAMLKEKIPGHPFWNDSRFARMIEYMLSRTYEEELDTNPYGFPYNPPGFELPYALSVLKPMTQGELLRICTHWVNQQVKRCYNEETQMMDRSTEDSVTHSARIYEAGRLEDWLLQSIRVT
jgi:hypothetical protein